MNHTFMTPARRALAVATLAPVLLAASACSNSDSSNSSNSAKSNSTTTASAPMAQSVQATNVWAKASDSGMSAAFGDLKNTGKRPIIITKVSGNNGPMQLHVTQKTADGTMEMKETKAFTIPAGGSLDLKPGGNHMMFMNLTKPLKAGDTNNLTVTFQDGSTKQLTVPVRAYDGAKEKYQGGASHSPSSEAPGSGSGMSGMSGMSHSSTH